jgi:hypothetical protein
MFRFLAICLILSSCHSFAQKLDLGTIKNDTSFSCRGVLVFDNRSIDSLYGLGNLCASSNAVEIRLGIMYQPFPIFDIVVLSFNGNIWSAKKIEASLSDMLYGDRKKIRVHTLIAKIDLDSVFNYLKANSIFNLPDQDEIKPDGLVDDGAYYFLTYKAGNSFGSYKFNNPGYYKDKYREIPQFSNYTAIKDVFESWLKKE